MKQHDKIIYNIEIRTQRKPKPIAPEFSGSYDNAASFKRNLPNASRKLSYWSASVGNNQQYTIGIDGELATIACAVLSPKDLPISFIIPISFGKLHTTSVLVD